MSDDHRHDAAAQVGFRACERLRSKPMWTLTHPAAQKRSL
jgi:hypothetical protein